jgi:hypothetical protein
MNLRLKNVMKTLRMTLKDRFDTSEYPRDHPSGIKTGVSKKVIGMFKDMRLLEKISELVGLRAKLYSYEMFECEEYANAEEHRKSKGERKMWYRVL